MKNQWHQYFSIFARVRVISRGVRSLARVAADRGALVQIVTVAGSSEVHGLTIVVGSSQQPCPSAVNWPCGCVPGSTAVAGLHAVPPAHTPELPGVDMHTVVLIGAAFPVQLLGVTDAVTARTPPGSTSTAGGESRKVQVKFAGGEAVAAVTGAMAVASVAAMATTARDHVIRGSYRRNTFRRSCRRRRSREPRFRRDLRQHMPFALSIPWLRGQRGTETPTRPQ